MKPFAWLILAFAWCAGLAAAAIAPESVAILCNAAVPESKQLAEQYRKARGIPEGNVVPLEMPVAADITRADFERSILKPLRKEFDTRSWWVRQPDPNNGVIPVRNKIKVLVIMRGVPLRIQPVPRTAAPAADPKNPLAGHDEASVDSELALFGVEGVPTDGVLQNKFYKSEVSITEVAMPFLLLVSRIDAPTFATCQRMIVDAVATEKTGLWGRAYVDIANKFPQGDEWLGAVVKTDLEAGIPTVVDRFNDTLPKNYPMTDASLYYGWYDWHVSGPFLNSKFRFRPGAVAMHLHSFSAEQLSDPAKNWSGALLEKGAAVTVGNVYEPYLHLTHDFSILHQRLLAGFSWVESCWMAMPVTSWQGVVLGDPLYRPFGHFDGSGEVKPVDVEFRALRAAMVKWKTDPTERLAQLGKAGSRMKSGVLFEDLGLEAIERGDTVGAMTAFTQAKILYVKPEDKVRQEMNLIGIDRAAGRTEMAVAALRNGGVRYPSLPEAEAFKGWLEILHPTPAPGK